MDPAFTGDGGLEPSPEQTLDLTGTTSPAPADEAALVNPQFGDPENPDDGYTEPPDDPEDPLLDGGGTTGDVVPEPDPGEADCVNNKRFFIEKLWTPILMNSCSNCHRQGGEADAKGSAFLFADAYTTGFLDYNLEVLKTIAAYEKGGEKLILLKPLGGDSHGGKIVMAKGTPAYAVLQEMVQRFDIPEECPDNGFELASALSSLEQLTSIETLRKASLTLMGSQPPAVLLEMVGIAGEAGLAAAVDLMMNPATLEFDKGVDYPRENGRYMFEVRVKEWFNEVWQTRAYYKNASALLDAGDYPNWNWQGNCDVAINPHCNSTISILGMDLDGYADVNGNVSYNTWAKVWTDRSLAEEPLELVSHLVKHDLPMSGLMTADYTMVNPFTKVTYGASSALFNNPYDPNEWVPAKVALADGTSIPHAGVITNTWWMNRFPTTTTNVNRHRTANFYRQFLATDPEKLAERPVDQSKIESNNPTMHEKDCAVCHAVVDPIAGALLNWDEKGRYRPPAGGWKTDMRDPGYADEKLPKFEYDHALQWLSKRVIADRRFALSMVHWVFRSLTGQAPVEAPTHTDDPDYVLRLNVYLQADAYYQTLADVFIGGETCMATFPSADNPSPGAPGEGCYNMKRLIKAIIMGPYFRAENLISAGTGPTDDGVAQVLLSDMGTARLLHPEQLNRRIHSVFGQGWQKDGQDRLVGDMLYYYGGVDLNTLSKRMTSPNGTVANIIERMANEMACDSVAQDMWLYEAKDRLLFPYVEFDWTPVVYEFAEVPEIVTAIKQNMVYLHERILGEELELDSPEIQRTYDLWYAVWEKGMEQVESGDTTPNLPTRCQVIKDPVTGATLPLEEQLINDSMYTLRAWMGVVSYLLTDYKFLYE